MKALSLVFLAAALNAAAQYQIDWFTLDGGGGQSSGGAYTLVGAIGQAEAAISSGGAYTLSGGFWSAFVVAQTEEAAPWLRIVHSDGQVLLAWPNPSTGFQLQESAGLVSPNWTDVKDVPTVIGDQQQVRQTLALAPRFYRLHKP